MNRRNIKEKAEGIQDTLGGRILFLKQRLEDLCFQRKLLNKSKKANMAICCEKTNMPTQWGCQNTNARKRKRKQKRKRKKYKNSKRFKYNPKRKYFKRKRKIQKNKNKEIKRKNQKLKSQCECWNCGEKGHLSYECNKKKVKILIQDFEDIESKSCMILCLQNFEDIQEKKAT